MIRARTFLRDIRGAMAAEFALVLPIMLLFLFGIMDVGYYAWAINQGEKATQMGARWAVATDMVPEDLYDYSFAASGEVPQGTPVGEGFFSGVTCTENKCEECPENKCEVCIDGGCSPSQWGYDGVAFGRIVDRMQDFKSTIEPDKVRIEYTWSGLGYSGDPNGPDVAPIVTVRLIDMEHRPLFGLLIGSVDLPEFAYSLTSEDGEGTISN